MRSEQVMGLRLQELRQAAGMSQPDLAEAAGIPVGTIRGWEQGRRLPSLKHACAIATALHITLDELVQGVFTTEAKPKARPKRGRARRQDWQEPPSSE